MASCSILRACSLIRRMYLLSRLPYVCPSDSLFQTLFASQVHLPGRGPRAGPRPFVVASALEIRGWIHRGFIENSSWYVSIKERRGPASAPSFFQPAPVFVLKPRLPRARLPYTSCDSVHQRRNITSQLTKRSRSLPPKQVS